jgi:hypothetical protein
LILAVLGTCLGLSLALAFAGKLVTFFSQASEFYQDLAVRPVPISRATIAVALAVGVPMALLACIEPALRVGSNRPLEVLYGRHRAVSPRVRIPGLLVLGVASLGLFLEAVSAHTLEPGPRLGSAVGFGVVAVWALSSVLVPAALPKLQTVLAGAVPRIGVLVGASVGDRPVEAGVTVAIWAAVVAATFSLLTSLNSLGLSMDEFIAGESGPTAIMAFGDDPRSTAPSGRLPISPAVVSAIEATPGVSAAWGARSTTVIFRGEEVPIDDYDVEKLISHGGLRSVSEQPAASISALRRGELLASDAFRWRFGVEIGDTIALNTAEGVRSFRVGGAARSFSGPKGKLYLSSTEFSECFRSRGADNVVFWIEGSVEDVLGRVKRSVRDVPLFFREGEAFRRQARRVIGRFSALLTIPLMVVGTIGLIGLANLLIGNVAARRRDLSLIRASGGTIWNILAVVGLSASIVAAFGTFSGMLLGLSWAIVIRDAITHFLGWRMTLSVDWGLLLPLGAGVLVAASCAATAAALLTLRREP